MKVLALVCALLPATALAAAPTFHKDVLPVLQSRCQQCHRPGEIGPMPLLNYQQARPWAKAIKEAVLLKRMPPWFADPRYGKFANNHALSEDQIRAITDWVDAGAPEGSPKDGPPPRKFVDGWNLPAPDLVLEMPGDFAIPASGKIDYQYIVVPTGFTEDRWVQMVEVRPSNRAVVHHSVIFIREPESKWLRDAKPGVPVAGGPRDTGGAGSEILTIYTPGMVPDVWKPGAAKLVKAGSDLIFQMHYTANGKAGTDRSRIGMTFAKQPPQKRVLTLLPANTGLRIPPGDPNYRVETKFRLPNPTEIVSYFPHMHLRGKAFEYRAVYPTGESETLLRVDPFRFNWQLSYKLEKPHPLPAGTVFECVAWFDNSPNNPDNPDPAKEVRWGEQSWEEMMIGFVDIAIDASMSRRDFFTPSKPVSGGATE